jgi:hypothetical protein
MKDEGSTNKSTSTTVLGIAIQNVFPYNGIKMIVIHPVYQSLQVESYFAIL